jgi:hypothetical protein
MKLPRPPLLEKGWKPDSRSAAYCSASFTTKLANHNRPRQIGKRAIGALAGAKVRPHSTPKQTVSNPRKPAGGRRNAIYSWVRCVIQLEFVKLDLDKLGLDDPKLNRPLGWSQNHPSIMPGDANWKQRGKVKLE